MDYRSVPLAKKIIQLVLLIAVLITYGCLDRIDFKVQGKEREAIVIQGKLEHGSPSRVEATITKLFDFTASSVTPIEVRSCVLMDEAGNTKPLLRTGRNTYEAIIPEDDPDIAIAFGKGYMMKVEAFDGRKFESSIEPLYDVPEPSDLRIEYYDRNNGVGSERTWIRLLLSTPIKFNDGSPAKLKWDIEEVAKITDSPISRDVTNPVSPSTCYVTTSLTTRKVALIDGEEFSGEQLVELTISETPLKVYYAEGTYFNVYQEGLSPDAYKYWEDIADIITRTGSMFDPPAGKLATNFKNTIEPIDDEVFGFFYASSQKVIRIFIPPDPFGNAIKYCPPTVEGQNPERICNYPPVCCDCAALPNSTIERPAWWIE